MPVEEKEKIPKLPPPTTLFLCKSMFAALFGNPSAKPATDKVIDLSNEESLIGVRVMKRFVSPQ